MATQNPIEYEGTYPLPEAQLDRFALRVSLGYPTLQEESRMLNEQTTEPPLDELEPVAGAAEALGLVEAAKGVFVEESLNKYVVALLRTTRADRLDRVPRRERSLEGEDVEIDLRASLGGAPPSLAVEESIGGLGDRRTELERHGRRASARYVLGALPRGRYPVESAVAVVE